jgi:hypothetical protein
MRVDVTLTGQRIKKNEKGRDSGKAGEGKGFTHPIMVGIRCKESVNSYVYNLFFATHAMPNIVSTMDSRRR